MRKVRLVNALQQSLLESVEAEKSAVLATTNGESKSLAQEAEQSAATIGALSAEVDRDLAALHEGGQVSADQLAAATQAWGDYQRVLKDVLRLSRENTNVISFDVSVHEKRRVTKACVAALSALLEAVDVGPKGAR